ncbi:alpha/beta hydrolase [Curvibacter sp. HBC28]|uniref:Alpha/beta hydrolase n=1 Tax=Curvibacter microcysteis TaxID=3026419 RepID=A0ABT5MF53_9BURK|nr:alpha/beta hydrolase [Curvibacter sp. HBC28]MDD0815202.1 alpha/beta hydrolase [Curvibacter sp. HBC28]
MPTPPADRPHRLSSAMQGVIDRMARAARPALHALTPRQARMAYAAGAGVLEINRPELPFVHDWLIPARDGAQLPARLYKPVLSASQPVLLYFHGGGFTVGSIDTHDTLCRSLALQSGCAVVSLDYRLAPEHRFPVASNDAWDALAWLLVHGASLGLDPKRVAVGGDSAGGTLAAATAVEAALRGQPLALQLLFYPGVSAHQDTDSHRRYAEGLVLEASHIQWFFGQYVHSREEREDWRFAPLHAPDTEQLAPAWIGLAEFDPLFDEGLAYADKLRLAGHSVDLEVYRGVTHEFIKMGRAVPEALQAHRDAGAALRQALNPTE